MLPNPNATPQPWRACTRHELISARTVGTTYNETKWKGRCRRRLWDTRWVQYRHLILPKWIVRIMTWLYLAFLRPLPVSMSAFWYSMYHASPSYRHTNYIIPLVLSSLSVLAFYAELALVAPVLGDSSLSVIIHHASIQIMIGPTRSKDRYLYQRTPLILAALY